MANGNITKRVIGTNKFALSYDAGNRLVSVGGPSLSASFVYDADGNRVKSTINGTTTSFVRNYYEVTGSTRVGLKIDDCGLRVNGCELGAASH